MSRISWYKLNRMKKEEYEQRREIQALRMELNTKDQEPIFNLNDLEKAFMGGINRGCYIASLITQNPIDGDYPTFEEFVKKEFDITIIKEKGN